MATNLLPPGTMVGRYRIEQPIAQGGPDGPVYRAHDAATSRRVTLLEFLPPGIAERAARGEAPFAVEPTDFDFRPLFAAGIAEIQALAADFAAFRHANVLPLLDCFAANDTVYLAVEAPDGRTLDRLLGPSEALSPDEVQEIMPTLFAGADAIHKAGLLHLDICPAAIAIRRDGSAALGRAHLVRRTLGATARGATPALAARDAYRAEEYFQPSGKLGPWTDIYALCATLFRLATGKPPPDPLKRRRDVAGGLPEGRCIDPVRLRDVGASSFSSRSAPTRTGCNCIQSIDIGEYDTCPQGCAYCYANRDQESAAMNLKEHSDTSESILCLGPSDPVTVNGQMHLFDRGSEPQTRGFTA